MSRIAVTRMVDVSHGAVWAALADLGSHDRWMRDAHSIEFTTEQTTGVGTRLAVETRVGPLRTLDVIEVTGWDEGHSIEVVHHGLVKGRGTLSATAQGEQTLLSWEEDLSFPWWLGGVIAAWIARPALTALWRGNLDRLEQSLTSP